MSQEIKEKYLPIGTVVMLKNASKRIMITGFCIIPDEDKTKMYDYLGCLYPEGMIDPKQNLMFNHEQIEKIYHMGLEDDEEKSFKKNMKELLNKTNDTSPFKKSEPVLTKLEEI